MVTIPLGQPGIASSEDEVFAIAKELFYADHQIVNDSFTQPANTTLLRGQVVGLDGSRNLVPAQSGSINAIGVMPFDSVTGGTAKIVQVYVEGLFNIDALLWHASYSTDILKQDAFIAGGRSNIFVKRGYHGF